MSVVHISSEGIGNSLKAYCGVTRRRGATIETARPWEVEKHPSDHWCPTCVRHASRAVRKAHLPEVPLGNTPRTAYHASHGLVRVIAYHGDGRFTVLGKGDKQVTVHRNSLSFRRERKGNAIGKRANWYRELRDPRIVGQVLHPARHPQAWALGSAGAAGAAAHTPPVQRRAGRHDMAADAAVGALAGQTAYQAAGYAPSHYARHKVGWNTRLSAITDPAQRAQHKAEDKARKANIRAHTDPATGKVDWTGHYRNFPAEHRYARVFRTVGRTHRGRSGAVIGATFTGAGAAIGAHHGHREMLGKSVDYGVRERRLRPTRAAEFAAGTAGVAWGLPRLRMLGPAIARGARLVERHGGAEAARAAVLAADTASAALRAGTKPLEAIRAFGSVNHLVEAVPSQLRPAVATTAGALLATHAVPVHRDRFHPVRSR